MGLVTSPCTPRMILIATPTYGISPASRSRNDSDSARLIAIGYAAPGMSIAAWATGMYSPASSDLPNWLASSGAPGSFSHSRVSSAVFWSTRPARMSGRSGRSPTRTSSPTRSPRFSMFTLNRWFENEPPITSGVSRPATSPGLPSSVMMSSRFIRMLSSFSAVHPACSSTVRGPFLVWCTDDSPSSMPACSPSCPGAMSRLKPRERWVPFLGLGFLGSANLRWRGSTCASSASRLTDSVTCLADCTATPSA